MHYLLLLYTCTISGFKTSKLFWIDTFAHPRRMLKFSYISIKIQKSKNLRAMRMSIYNVLRECRSAIIVVLIQKSQMAS